MKNAHNKRKGMQLEGFSVEETPSYVYLRSLMSMKNDMDDKLNRCNRAAWTTFRPFREATDIYKPGDLQV